MSSTQSALAQFTADFSSDEGTRIGKMDRGTLERVLAWDPDRRSVHAFSSRWTDDMDAYSLSGSNIFENSAYFMGMMQNLALTLSGATGTVEAVQEIEVEIEEAEAKGDTTKAKSLKARLELMRLHAAGEVGGTRWANKMIELFGGAEGIFTNLALTVYHTLTDSKDPTQKRMRESNLINAVLSTFLGTSGANIVSGIVEQAQYYHGDLFPGFLSDVDFAKRLRRSGMAPTEFDWPRFLGYVILNGLGLVPKKVDSEYMLKRLKYLNNQLGRTLSNTMYKEEQVLLKNIKD